MLNTYTDSLLDPLINGCSEEVAISLNAGIDHKNFDMPEKHLWAAVLNQTISDVKNLCALASKKPQLLELAAFHSEVSVMVEYFQCESMEPGSLGFICAWLDLDPESVQHKVMNEYLTPLLTKIENARIQLH